MSASAGWRSVTAFGMLAGSAMVAHAQAIAVARVGYTEGHVERSRVDADWDQAREGADVYIGDRYRTGPSSRVRIDFRWMSVAIDSSSQLSIPNDVILSAALEHGRVEPYSSTGAIIKVVTAEASVRGEGRVAVRRRDATTFVSVLSGSFSVQPPGQSPVEVLEGHGVVVAADAERLDVVPLAPPPSGAQPSAADAAYVRRGEPAFVSWDADEAGRFHVELLGYDGVEVVRGQDVSGGRVALDVAWTGTFRWRVSAFDARGLEGMPSETGILCVVDK